MKYQFPYNFMLLPTYSQYSIAALSCLPDWLLGSESMPGVGYLDTPIGAIYCIKYTPIVFRNMSQHFNPTFGM